MQLDWGRPHCWSFSLDATDALTGLHESSVNSETALLTRQQLAWQAIAAGQFTVTDRPRGGQLITLNADTVPTPDLAPSQFLGDLAVSITMARQGS